MVQRPQTFTHSPHFVYNPIKRLMTIGMHAVTMSLIRLRPCQGDRKFIKAKQCTWWGTTIQVLNCAYKYCAKAVKDQHAET